MASGNWNLFYEADLLTPAYDYRCKQASDLDEDADKLPVFLPPEIRKR